VDPIQLFQIQQMIRQQQAAQPMGQQPVGQLPSYTQQQQAPQQLPAMGDPSQQQHHGGINPLMFLSPMAGLMASHPGAAMFGISPALGFARMFGAFK
jgi:hypothetical protein